MGAHAEVLDGQAGRWDNSTREHGFSLSHLVAQEEVSMATVTSKKPSAPKAPKVKDCPLLIGGKWLDSVSGKTFATTNPATGETICHVAEGDKAGINLDVAPARNA